MNQQPLTKDSTTRAKRRENAKRRDRRRPAFARAAAPSPRKAYRRPAPGSLTNAITKED